MLYIMKLTAVSHLEPVLSIVRRAYCYATHGPLFLSLLVTTDMCICQNANCIMSQLSMDRPGRFLSGQHTQKSCFINIIYIFMGYYGNLKAELTPIILLCFCT